MAAYRRKQQQQQDPSPSPISYSFHEEIKNPNDRISNSSRIEDPNSPITQIPPTSSANPSLAAKAIKASSAHMDSSLSSAYVLHSPSSSSPSPHSSSAMDSNLHEYTSMKNLNESKHGFWGSLARKAKAILDDDNVPAQSDRPGRSRIPVDTETESKYHNTYRPPESYRKSDNPTPPLQKGLGAIASSLTSIGGAIGNALEEGLTVVENRTADIIQNRKLHIRKKGSGTQTGNQANDVDRTRQQQFSRSQVQPQTQTDQNIQLKASRDVAMAMAAKAKLLLRELKTVKSDLAFAKDRCAQLEEENRYLRENREKGNNMEDDDLIRLQLETLLAEKARLAQENSVFARENRFLREVVEYHQLTMQDVVYLNEGTEEVTEVYPISMPSMTNLPSSAGPSEAPHNRNLQTNQHVYPVPMSPLEFMEVSKSGDLKGSDSLIPAENIKR